MSFKEDKKQYMQRRNAIRSMRSAGISDELIAANLNIKLEELNDYNEKWSIKYYDKKIVEMYESGMTGQQIADEIGYTTSGICQYLRKNHRDIYKGYSPEIPKPVREMMVKWAKEGKTVNDICELTGYSYVRVYPFVQEIVRKHPPGWNDRLTQEKKDKIIELYLHQGKSKTEIAQIIGVNYSTVWRLLKRTGNDKLKNDKNSQKEQTQQQVGETKL